MEEGVFYIPLFVRCGTDSYSHIIASGGVQYFASIPNIKLTFHIFPFLSARISYLMRMGLLFPQINGSSRQLSQS